MNRNSRNVNSWRNGNTWRRFFGGEGTQCIIKQTFINANRLSVYSFEISSEGIWAGHDFGYWSRSPAPPPARTATANMCCVINSIGCQSCRESNSRSGLWIQGYQQTCAPYLKEFVIPVSSISAKSRNRSAASGGLFIILWINEWILLLISRPWTRRWSPGMYTQTVDGI